MIKKFYLTAATKLTNLKDEHSVLSMIELENNSLSSMIKEWDKEYQDFAYDIEELSLRDTLKTTGRCRISVMPYKLPSWITKYSIGNIHEMEEDPEIQNKNIKCFVAFAQDSQDRHILLFQKFSPAKLLTPNSVLRKSKIREGYEMIETEGFLLDQGLTAVYIYEYKKLLFNSYHNVKSFLPLDDQYMDASSEDIIEILSHEIFDCPDKQIIANSCSLKLRKYFTRIKNSGILNKLTINDVNIIKYECDKTNTYINISQGKIVFLHQDSEDHMVENLALINQDLYMTYKTNEKNIVLQRKPVKVKSKAS